MRLRVCPASAPDSLIINEPARFAPGGFFRTYPIRRNVIEASTSSAVAPVSASAVEAVRLTVVVPAEVMSVCNIYDAALSLLSMRVCVEEMAVPLLRRTASAFTAEPVGGLSTAVTRYVPGVTSVNVPALCVTEEVGCAMKVGKVIGVLAAAVSVPSTPPKA